MTYLLETQPVLPDQTAHLPQDYALLEISYLQAKLYNDFYGLQQIPVAKEQTLEELLNAAVASVLKKSCLQAEKISYVIHAHTSLTKAPYFYNILQRVVTKNNFTKANSFGFNLNKCASGIESLDLINTIFTAEKTCQYILLITGDIALTSQQRLLQNASIAGDVCAAALFGRVKHNKHCSRLLSVSKQVYPEFFKGAWLSREQSMLFEKRFPTMMADVIKHAVNKAGINLSQVSYILPHNVNIPVWKKISAEINVDMEKIYIANIVRYGHCFAADFLINYSSLKNHLQADEFFVVASVGFGLTFVAAVFQKVIGE
jgi:3-oxoacyl-[acyl-carrier-protein] synthase III